MSCGPLPGRLVGNPQPGGEAECAPLPLFAFQVDPPAHQFHDTTRNSQSQSRAPEPPRGGAVGLFKDIEDGRPLLGFVIEVHREWAPNGADRFYNLVGIGYFDNVAFFRVLPGFMAQAGMHGDPAVSRAWLNSRFQVSSPVASV